MADNNEHQQPPNNGVPQQNVRGDKNPRNCNNGAYSRADKDFSVVTPEIGGVLTLPTRMYTKKRAGYVKFKKLLANYIVKNFQESIKVANAAKTLKIQ